MNGVPEHLVHVAKIEGGRLERVITQHSLVTHLQAVDDHHQSQKRPGQARLPAQIK